MTHIQISDITARVSYTASSSLTYSVPFAFFAVSDLKVYINGVLATYTTDYTVSGAGESNGGSITFVASQTGKTILIIRSVPYARTTDFPTAGPFDITALNTDLDKMVAQVQQVRDQSTLKNICLPDADSTSINTVLPVAASRINKAIVFDSNGGVAVSTDDYVNQATDAAASAAAASSSASAASASASAASTSASNAATSATNATTNGAAQVTLAAAQVTLATTQATNAANSASAAAASAAALPSAAAIGNGKVPQSNGTTWTGVTALVSADIGVTVQGYDATILKAADVGTTASKIVQLDGSARLPAVDGSQLTGISGIDTTARLDILELQLQMAISNALAANGYTSSFCDVFNSDTIGANSTGQTYDGSNKLYSPTLGTTSYANAGGQGDRTASITVTYSGSWSVNPSSGLVNGSTSTAGQAVNSHLTAASGQSITFYFGSGSNKVIQEVSCYGGSGSSSSWGTWKWQGSNDGSSWTDVGSSFTLSQTAGASFVVGTGVLTSNTTGYDYWRLQGVSGTATDDDGICEFTFKIAAGPLTSAMTLISNAMSPAPGSSPTNLTAVVLYKAVDASTLNTDMLFYASEDGSTYTQGTLTDSGLTMGAGPYKVLTASVAPGGSGTTVKWKLVTANGKNQQIKGVAYLVR